MSNPGTANLLTTAAVARLHLRKVQARALGAIADAKQPRDLLPVKSLRGDAVLHLPPLTPEPMPTPEPEPEREPEPLPDQDPEPRPGQEPLWSLPASGFMPVTVPAPGSAVAASLQ
jgi:hypothetical protein